MRPCRPVQASHGTAALWRSLACSVKKASLQCRQGFFAAQRSLVRKGIGTPLRRTHPTPWFQNSYTARGAPVPDTLICCEASRRHGSVGSHASRVARQRKTEHSHTRAPPLCRDKPKAPRKVRRSTPVPRKLQRNEIFVEKSGALWRILCNFEAKNHLYCTHAIFR